MMWRGPQKRLAIVGCGQMGRRHAVSATAHRLARVVAVTDTNEEVAQQLSLEIGAEYRPKIDAILEDRCIDAVVLATPHNVHYAQICQSLAAGKHVFVEKPMALSYADSVAAVASADRAGRVLVVGQVMRFWANLWRARQDVTAGTIGEVRQVVRHRLVFQPSAQRAWADDPAQSGPWLLYGNLVHDVDAVLWCLGEPAETVYLAGASTNPKWQSDDEIVAVIRFSNGAVGTIVGSLNSRETRMDMLIVGTRGTIALDEMGRGYLVNGTRTVLQASDGISAQMAEFVTHVAGLSGNRATADSVLPTMQVLDALAESGRSGQPVSMSRSAAKSWQSNSPKCARKCEDWAG